MPYQHHGEFSSLSRGGGDSWPSPWPTHADDWPSPPERWTPTRPGKAVTLCIRGTEGFELVEWDSIDEAIEAAMTLFTEPCGKGCRRCHSLLWVDMHKLHVKPVIGDPAPPTRLDECYPRHVNGNTISNEPRLWRCPPEWNQPLTNGATRNGH